MESGKPQKKCCLFSARVVGMEIKSTRKKSWEGFFPPAGEGYNSRRPFHGIHANYWPFIPFRRFHEEILSLPSLSLCGSWPELMNFGQSLIYQPLELNYCQLELAEHNCGVFYCPLRFFCPMDGWSANKSLECFTKWFESKQKICMHTHTINLHLLYTEQ